MGILRILIPHVPNGYLIVAPIDVLVDEFNVYQPDIVVLAAQPPMNSNYIATPRVSFEILSPGSARRDREIKLPRLLTLGVEEVWIIDPIQRVIERSTKDGMEIARGDDTLASTVVRGFDLSPARIFG